MNSEWSYDDQNHCFNISAIKDITKGDEACISYGKGISNFDVFIGYGFVCENNKYDEVQIEINLNESSNEMYQEKIKHLETFLWK